VSSARCRWITLHTSNPMGQQNYETAIQSALRDLAPVEWTFESCTFGGLRSGADLRLPTRVLRTLPDDFKPVAKWLAGGAALTHRFDLRIPAASGPEVVTAHDLPPLRFADEGSLPPWALRTLRGKHVICPSTFAGEELATLLDADTVHVIPYGIRSVFLEATPLGEVELEALGIRPPFVLHAAGSTVRKNLKGLARAWELASASLPAHHLVLAGPTDGVRTSLFDALPRVIFLGRQPLETIARIMASSDCVVVPSTYEGFGLPALEGMATGTAVIAANAGALPEVCGDGAIIAEPDGASLADALIAVLNDPSTTVGLRDRARKRARSFDWRVAAERHLDVYARASRS
jgi:glycosyltransferase involved in cell wall biosynthesis